MDSTGNHLKLLHTADQKLDDFLTDLGRSVCLLKDGNLLLLGSSVKRRMAFSRSSLTSAEAVLRQLEKRMIAMLSFFSWPNVEFGNKMESL